MLPIRAVLESAGYELDWDGATQTVIISTDTTTNELYLEELILALQDRGIQFDDVVDGRPVFVLTSSEVESIIAFLGEERVAGRFDFFGTSGYMREHNGRTVFFIYQID